MAEIKITKCKSCGASITWIKTKDVRIYLNGVIDDAHAFKLAAAADNYLQQNKMLEFQVKKYEVR